MRNRIRRGEGGAALVELALATPLLVVLIVGVVDFARVFYMAMQVTNAARAGAQYGSTPGVGFTPGGVQAVAQTASPQASPTISTPVESCYCVNDDLTSSTAQACSTPCSSTTHSEVFVTVTASKNFSTVMRYPGVPGTITLTRTVTLRKQ